MKKSSTTNSHYEQINLALAYIHRHFGEEITAEDLAKISGYSIFHFHRIFKEITQENVNDYLRNARLEKASNLLLYNQHKTVEEIALSSGFKSATSFGAAFKKKFNHTPKEWRTGGYEKNCEYIKQNTNTNIKEIKEPQIVINSEIPMVYIKVDGYKNDMSSAWETLTSWCEQKDVFTKPHRFIGLFHNHPSSSKYEDARFLACIETNEEVYRNGEIGKCVVNNGLFAKFTFTCNQKELYNLMHQAYMNWLPKSHYEVRNFPAYVEYKNPQKLLTNDSLDIDFYMPIQEQN